jgi:hypothetical protein
VFDIYVLFLILSGIAMLVMAGVGTGQKPARRIWNLVLGAGFTIYGLYLLLFFHGGSYVMFFYVFALPIFMIVQFFRDRPAYQDPPQATGFQAPPPSGYGQPPGDGQPPFYDQAPGYGQPSGFDQPSENQPPGQ